MNLGVTKDGNKDEFVNDSQVFDRLDLFVPVISLVERQGDMEEKVLNAEIGAVIGRKLADFDLMEAEVQDCRRHWLDVSESAVIERQATRDNLITYNYCALLVAPHVKPFNVRDQFEPLIHYVDGRGTTKQLSFSVNPTMKVNELMQRVFSHGEIRKVFKRYTAKDIVLKVCGTEEYLLEKVELYRYKVSTVSLVAKITIMLVFTLVGVFNFFRFSMQYYSYTGSVCLSQLPPSLLPTQYINKCLESHQTVGLVALPYEVIAEIEVDKFIRPVHGKHQDSVDR